jgi:hypothetical protein
MALPLFATTNRRQPKIGGALLNWRIPAGANQRQA